jgi:hypothetical protein
MEDTVRRSPDGPLLHPAHRPPPQQLQPPNGGIGLADDFRQYFSWATEGLAIRRQRIERWQRKPAS